MNWGMIVLGNLEFGLIMREVIEWGNEFIEFVIGFLLIRWEGRIECCKL